MSELPPSDDAGMNDEAGTPRWVKISAAVTVAVVVLVIVLMLLGGDHGPGRHL